MTRQQQQNSVCSLFFFQNNFFHFSKQKKMSASATNHLDNNKDEEKIEDESALFNVDLKEISKIILCMNQWDLDALGGVDRFIKMTRFFEKKNRSKSSLVDEQEFIRHFGISSATIGDRIAKFGSGDMKIRDHPRFAEALTDKHSNLISDLSFMEDPYMTEDDKRDSCDYFFSGRGLRFVDHIQNRMLYDVIRDGEKIKLYGSQLVFGDILILEANQSRNVWLEEFEKKIKQEEENEKKDTCSQTKRKNNKDDDDDDNNEKTNNNHEPVHENNSNDPVKKEKPGVVASDDVPKTKKDEEQERKERHRQMQQRRRLSTAHETRIPADCLVLEGSVDQDCVDLTGENLVYGCTRQRTPHLIAGARIISGKCHALVVGVGHNSNLEIFHFLFLDRQGESSFKKCRHCACC